jgi:hypothetical protein
MIKDSLYKRVAAIETQGGPGIQINTVADWARIAAMEIEGRWHPALTFSPVMQKFCDDWHQFAIDDDIEQAWAQWEMWLV